MPIAHCYSRDQLQDFLLGKLPDEKCGLIAEHLDHCEICEDTIVGLESASDTLVELLRINTRSSSHHQDTDSALNSQTPNSLPEFRNALRRINNFEFDRTNVADTKPQLLEQIGEYEIGAQIASGGMGSVYRARHLRLEKTVAIKVLPERKMQSSDAIARFSREMKIIGQMDHPSMVRATDAGEFNGTHYLVMELVEGLDLSRIVRLVGKLSPENAAEVIRTAAIGLHYAHERGVVHRDVKPSNLMLNRDGAIKILDLGLATLGGMHGTVDELTTVGQLMGTLDYMAPEQCGNSHPVDSRTDIYGLGATLYKLLTGSAPYSRPNANTPLQKLKAMAVEQPIPVRERRPELSADLAAVVEKCLQRDPADRFPSAHALSVALEPFTVGHVLKSLLNSAEKLDAERKERPIRHAASLEFPPVNSLAKEKHRSDKRTSQTRMNWIGNSMKFVTAMVMIGLLAWGGITIYLNTIAGQLIINSEIDDINVSVVQDEKPTRQIQVEHGSNATRLRAGKYQIEIVGETDGLVIDNEQFELKRGGKVVVTISRRDVGLSTTSDLREPPSTLHDDVLKKSAQRNSLELIELHDAVEVATVKLTFLRKKVEQYKQQHLAGLKPVDQLDQAQLELELAELELSKAKRRLDSHLKSMVESQSSVNQSMASKSDDITASLTPGTQRLDLIEFEHAVNTALVKLESAQRLVASPVRDGRDAREALEDQTNLKLAELEYESARSRLSAAKKWIEEQAQVKKRGLERDVQFAQAQLAQHNEVLEQTKRLFQRGFVTQSQVKSAEFKHETLTRQLADLQLQLSVSTSANSNIAEGSGGRPGPELTDAKPGNRRTAAAEAAENQPTFQGQLLVEYLDFTINNALGPFHQDVDRSSAPAIRQLVPQTSVAHLENLFNETTNQYENEVDLDTQFRVIYSLALICSVEAKDVSGSAGKESGSLTHRLLEYALSVFARNWPRPSGYQAIGQVSKGNLSDALRPLTDSHFETVQQFLLSKYKNGSAAEKIAGLDWLDSLKRNTGGNKFRENPAVSEKWVPMLLLDTKHENPSIASEAAQALTRHWGGEANVLESFKNLIHSPNQEVRHQAILLVSSRIPNLEGLPELTKKAVAEGLSPAVFTHFINDGGLPLIKEFLVKPLNKNEVGHRTELMRAIAQMAERDQLDDSQKRSLTELVVEETNRDAPSQLYQASVWDAYRVLTGNPIPKLHQGHDIVYWRTKLASKETPRGIKRHCVDAIEQLDGGLSRESLMAIAAGVRGGKHEQQHRPADLDLESRAARMYLTHKGLEILLGDLDQLAEKDLSFTLFVLSRCTYTSKDQLNLVFDFVEPFLSSDDRLVRRRATAVICKFPKSTQIDPVGSQRMRFYADRQLDEIMESDRGSIEQKLAIIETNLSRSNLNLGYRLSEFFEPEKLNPEELVTFLSLAIKESPSCAAVLSLRLLAANPEYLDQEFAPLTLDLWYLPADSEVKNSSEAKLRKPIDLILEIVEMNGENLLFKLAKTGDPNWVKSAAKTLQSRLGTTTGTNRKKIERALERLTPTSKK